MAKQETDFGTFVVGFFFGALVGGATALLFAPQSGEETRDQIRQKSIELSEQAQEKAEEARTKAETMLNDAREKFDEATKELQTRAKEMQKQVESLAKGAGEKAAEVVES
jgi:gas vesicle protein